MSKAVQWRAPSYVTSDPFGPTATSVARAPLVAVGPNGSDITYDGARHWTAFDTAAYDAVDCVPGTCWASGPAGAVALLYGL